MTSKYLGSYVGSTERYVKVQFGLAWAAFAIVKTILRSSKVRQKFKIRLFKAECISILLYGWDRLILTEALVDKLRKKMRAYHTRYLNSPEITSQTSAYIILLAKRLSASGILSSRVIVFARRKTSPSTALSSMNPRSGNLFDQRCQGRHISIKFRLTFYLARKHSKPKK